MEINGTSTELNIRKATPGHRFFWNFFNKLCDDSELSHPSLSIQNLVIFPMSGSRASQRAALGMFPVDLDDQLVKGSRYFRATETFGNVSGTVAANLG